MPRIVKNIPLMDLAAYLIESVDSPTHVGMLQVFQPVKGSRSEIVQRVLKAFRECEVGPPFNYYPVFPRFGMPKWALAEDFDSTYHIRHAALPQPGTERQLIDMVMDLHAGIMDRSRPGWIAYVIEGLEDDRFAVYWKVHHAYIDGASAIMRFEAAMARSADDLEIRPLWGPLFEPSGGDRDMSLGARLSEAGKGLGTQARAMKDISQAISRAVKQAQGRLQRESPIPFSAPKSLYNKPVFATRNLGVAATGLDRFKAIASQEKVSINEVALTLVGAALDRYSKLHGETQAGQLVAACPMAVREEGDTDASTQIAAISIKLGDATMSISERLQQVHASSKDAKAEAKNMSREALINYLVLTGGAATLLAKTPLADYMPPLTSVNVSNVAGPRFRAYMGGAEMIRSYPVSTLAGGTAINITFSSFSGRMDYAVITDAQAIPGAQEIADYMSDAMDELEAVLRPKKTRAKKKAPPVKKKAPPAKKKAARAKAAPRKKPA
jgi:diacylglycerol O-acyltransferase